MDVVGRAKTTARSSSTSSARDRDRALERARCRRRRRSSAVATTVESVELLDGVVDERTRTTETTATTTMERVKSRRSTLAMFSAMVPIAMATEAMAATDGANALDAERAFEQTFPTLFRPFLGEGYRETRKREIVPNVLWALEQNIELGPLETVIRCVVIRLRDGTLWVHAPLAPTEEFFKMVESCGEGGASAVAHVVVPTYALEHKIYTKDALKRWKSATLATAPGQFTFPFRDVSDGVVFGKRVDYVLEGNDLTSSAPWKDEIEFETLRVGAFDVGANSQIIYETAFFHKASKTLVVTDALAQIPIESPESNSVDKLLVVSQRSTADSVPEDTREARQIGWEKTALLVNYFFPEHEELDPSHPGVVIWTDGWHENFQALAGRLLVPPVVRTLLYAQDPSSVKDWVRRVAVRWDPERVVPAHWEAPVAIDRERFERSFAFLDDESIDAFNPRDLERGLTPVANAVLKRK